MQTFSLKVQIFLLVCFVSVIAVVYQIQNLQTRSLNSKIIEGKYTQFTKESKRELVCLAENIYFEARNEPLEGMLAVAFVTINRVRSEDYPNTICDVVKQKIRSTCQFSWWCEEKPKSISTSQSLTKQSNSLYNQIMDLSVFFYLNHEKLRDPTKGALFYHADYVNPRWRNVSKTTQIGRHIFYERI